VAERILGTIRQPIRVGNTAVTIGATMGIAFADPSDTSSQEGFQPDAVVRRADTAMYQAKAAGRGRYAVFGS
jgi:GGDEF domain-containing protein